MRLKQFIGKNVRGYMNYNVSFRNQITFLIGINGSGKTTLIKLLSGLLSPSYIYLSEIEYSEIHLVYERLSDNKLFKISSYKHEDKLNIQYEDLITSEIIDGDISILNYNDDKRFIDNFSRIDSDKISRLLTEFDELEVIRKIRSIKTPLFLGLNRRISENNIISFEHDYYRRRLPNIDYSSDSVDEALNDIQEMVFSNIRLNASKQDKYSEDFRKKVIQDSFKVYDEDPSVTTNYKEELKKLSLRKEKLIAAISDLLNKEDIADQVDPLFEKLTAILKTLSTTASTHEGKLSNEYYEALLKWMINSSQLKKIDNITSYGNQYAENISKMKEPMIRFTDAVNLFFKEGHKELFIDRIGNIKIKIKGNGKSKNNSIHELSSGEKQLIIMMAHLAFYKTNKKGPIFIIDEPELSLHISWQEIFVDALIKASPETQFVLATHSPSILAKSERKNMCEDLSNNL